MLRRIFVFSLLAATLVAQQKKPVTLEALSSVRPSLGSQPVWAPDGKRFVFNQDGKLWLYDIPARSRRELAALSAFSAAAASTTPPDVSAWENRGVREETTQWFPSGKELLISSGGDLFRFKIDAGGWTQLTNTTDRERDPKLSPDGKRISFRRGHDLYVMELASGTKTRLTEDGSPAVLNAELDWVYPEELDLGTAHWWAPDSKSIAYLQFDVSREPIYPQVDLAGPRAKYEPERYPKAGEPNAEVRLGVVPVEGQIRTKWMDLGHTPDTLHARFHWLPDSSGIAIQRLNRVQNRLDLHIVDASTGSSRPVLRETDPHWVNVKDHFRFLKSGKEFLWSSERDGFAHLYWYSMEGKQLAQLTRGDWEVAQVAGVDESAGQVYFVSTERSPLERHLYRVGLDGGERRRISEKPGSHAISMGPTAEYYLDSFSNLTTPPGSTIHKNNGEQVAVFREPDRKPLEEYEILPTEIIRVKTSDSELLYARLIRPAGFQADKKYPAVVSVYGGPHAQSVRDSWQGVSFDQVLAHRGFVVWQLDNRGSAGRGHRFETPVFRNFGARELEDQKEGVKHLVAMGFVDPGRIGITGWSYGGYMTLYSMLNAPEVFKAGVAGAPVTDWRNYDTIYTERYMGLPSENEDGYRRASPVHKASSLKGDLLIVHNLEDDNVLVQNTIRMSDALQSAGKPFRMMLYSGKGHGLIGSGQRHFAEMRLKFFEECLKP